MPRGLPVGGDTDEAPLLRGVLARREVADLVLGPSLFPGLPSLPGWPRAWRGWPGLPRGAVGMWD